MNLYQRLQKNCSFIEEVLGYTFSDKQLLILSFVHRSFMNENREIVSEHNERLEFLGDSVLGLVIADYLYTHLPTESEGKLSYLRASLVDAASCGLYMQKLDLEKYILLGKGELLSAGRGRDSILADVFEAIVAALYLDGGLSVARKFIIEKFHSEITEIVQNPNVNFKADLQDYSQKVYQKLPLYRVLKEEGPDHQKTFTVIVSLEDRPLGTGRGSSKKEAEQRAAEEALRKIEKNSGGNG